MNNHSTLKDIRVPTQKRSIEKKEALLKAGFELFSELGFYKVNTKQIAKQAGVSIGSYYAYFEDKTQLFIELIHKYVGKIMNDVYCTTDGDLDNSVCISEEDYNRMSETELEATLATFKKDSTIYFTEAVLKAHERITNEFYLEMQYVASREPSVKEVLNEYTRFEEDSLKTSLLLLEDVLKS